MKNRKKEYHDLATTIIRLVGGEKNITNVIHCVTRLRFYLKDDTQVNEEELTNLKGVLGVVNAGGQYQIVVGATVEDIYKEVFSQLDLSDDQATTTETAVTLSEDSTPFDKIKHSVNQLIGIITGSVMPIINLLAASGIIKSLLAVLTASNLVSDTGDIYLIVSAMADAVFYFLPIFIGFNAAKRLGGNPLLTAVIGGIIIHPTVLEAANNGLNILSIGTFDFPYVAYTYSIFPMILAAWLVKKLEVWLKNWIPTFIQAIIVPILIIGIVASITFLITGPIIVWLSFALANGLQALLSLNAPIFGAIITGFYQILVIFGLHWGIVPIYVNDFATFGYSYLSAMVSMTIVAQGGAALAVAIKSKKADVKELGYAGAISAFSGITEPAIYGINLRFRKPFIFASIASAVGGFLTGLFQVNMWSIIGSIIGLPSFIDPENGITANFWYAVLITAITLFLAFILTYIWGYNDSMVMQEKRTKPKNPAKEKFI